MDKSTFMTVFTSMVVFVFGIFWGLVAASGVAVLFHLTLALVLLAVAYVVHSLTLRWLEADLPWGARGTLFLSGVMLLGFVFVTLSIPALLVSVALFALTRLF